MYRRATALGKDAFKVTTLTFENVYADGESSGATKHSSSSSSDEVQRDSPPASHANCGVAPSKSGLEASMLPAENVPASRESRCEDSDTEGAAGPALGAVEPPLPDDKDPDMTGSASSSSSSCPDIEWLFCHSDSDSEFSNVAKSSRAPRPGAEDVSPPLKTTREDSGDKEDGEEEEEEEDSWTAIRSSPEGDDPAHEEVKEKTPNLRDPEGVSRHGAIPKQRRQGLIVRETDHVGSSGAAGVTMDLVRKMLDVFSSYPDSRPGDIKKLLVLVSLEQDSRREQAGGAVPPRDEEGALSSPTDDAKDEEEEEGGFGKATPRPKEKDSTPDRVSSSLHRKPAVRRRRHPFETSGTAQSLPDKSSDQKFHKEYQVSFL